MSFFVPFWCLQTYLSISLPFCLLESKPCLNGHLLYPASPPGLFITLPHAYTHSLWGAPLTRLSICLTPTSSFFPPPLLFSPSLAHTLASALLPLLLPHTAICYKTTEGERGRKRVVKRGEWKDEDVKEDAKRDRKKMKRETGKGMWTQYERPERLSICYPPHLPSWHTATPQREYLTSHTQTHGKRGREKDRKEPSLSL